MEEEINYYQLEQPEEISTREKEDAMGSYLMMFASIGAGLPLPMLNLIAAIIYYNLNKGKSRFVRFHSLQSVLSQLPISILNGVGVIWAATYFFQANLDFSSDFKGYIITVLIFNIIYFIYSLIGAVRARKGRFYYFIFFGKLCYEIIYKIKDGISDPSKHSNLPPK